MSGKTLCILDKSILVRVLAALVIPLMIALWSPAVSSSLGASDGGCRAYAALTVGSSGASDTAVDTASSSAFYASKSSLDLTPKRKKIANGYKYVARSYTVTITAPSNCTVYWVSSDLHVADAKWGKFKNNKAKLKITGHARGTATITVTNNKTSKKLKIRVVVGGDDLVFRWGNEAEKCYTKPDGTNGYYSLDNVKLINNTGKKVVLDKRCVLKVWTVDADQNYKAKNQEMPIRGVPVVVKNKKSKTVYLGEKHYLDEFGKYVDGSEQAYWHKGCFTAKVGKGYKTYYVNEYGMVTKVRNGRDF